MLGEEGAESGGLGGFSKKEKRRPLGKGLSSYQLFKAALDFLGRDPSSSDQSVLIEFPARHDFTQERVFIKTKDGHRVCSLLLDLD